MLRETMSRAVRGEPSAGDAWARFQMRKRRGQRLRNLIVAAAGVGAAVALVFVLPTGLGEGPVTDIPGGGPNEPAFALVNRYADPVAKFEMHYPVDWSARGGPGKPVQFFVTVPDAPTVVLSDEQLGRTACVGRCGGTDDYVPVTEAPRVFFIEVTPIEPSCARALRRCAATRPMLDRRAVRFDGARIGELEQQGVTVGSEPVSLGEVLAARYAFLYPERPALAGPPPRYWCADCRLDEFVVDWYDGWKLDLRIMAPSEREFKDSIDLALRIVESLARFRLDDRL